MPAEPLEMQTEHVGQPPQPELLRGLLLALARRAVVALRVR